MYYVCTALLQCVCFLSVRCQKAGKTIQDNVYKTKSKETKMKSKAKYLQLTKVVVRRPDTRRNGEEGK